MDLVTLRPEGLYCPAGDFYIDPWRAVDRGVISHAHADHARSGHRHVLALGDSEAVLRVRLGARLPFQGLAPGESILHHGVRVSLHPAGHVLGSAQVRLAHGGQVWVVSGDYYLSEHDETNPTCPAFEPVRCDCFVTESTFGLPLYRWAPQAQVLAGINQWWADNADDGHASVLASTAHSDQTSPIRRGLWVRRNLLCQELPPPPPFAGGVPDVDPNATTRDRFAQHTANPACRSCHQYIDGVGFGFEQLDPVGRWRDTEQGHPIDATGELTDLEHLGSETSATYRTIPELARLVAGSRAAPACFVRQYYRFARGVQDSLAGRCARRALEQRFADSGGDVRQLMLDTLLSRDFVVRR